MGTFRYCECGDQGFDKPTAREDLVSYELQTCRCGKTLDQYMSVEEWIIDLDDRLRGIEAPAKEISAEPSHHARPYTYTDSVFGD